MVTLNSLKKIESVLKLDGRRSGGRKRGRDAMGRRGMEIAGGMAGWEGDGVSVAREGRGGGEETDVRLALLRRFRFSVHQPTRP